jgi:hypothetical protein
MNKGNPALRHSDPDPPLLFFLGPDLVYLYYGVHPYLLCLDDFDYAVLQHSLGIPSFRQ